MDEVEFAQGLAEAHRATALAAMLPLSRAPAALECADCDRPIPEARRRVMPGAETCVTCQERRETARPRLLEGA